MQVFGLPPCNFTELEFITNCTTMSPLKKPPPPPNKVA